MIWNWWDMSYWSGHLTCQHSSQESTSTNKQVFITTEHKTRDQWVDLTIVIFASLCPAKQLIVSKDKFVLGFQIYYIIGTKPTANWKYVYTTVRKIWAPILSSNIISYISWCIYGASCFFFLRLTWLSTESVSKFQMYNLFNWISHSIPTNNFFTMEHLVTGLKWIV